MGEFVKMATVKESKARGIFTHLVATDLQTNYGYPRFDAMQEAIKELGKSVNVQQYIQDNGYLWNDVKQEWVKID